MSPHRRDRRVFPGLAPALVACLALGCLPVMAAAVVNFDTGKSLALQTGGSGNITLSLTNAGDASAFVTSYTLGLLIVPTSGSGTLVFDAWTGPAANPLLSDVDAEYTPLGQPDGSATLIAPIDISGTEYFNYYSVQAANTNGFDDPLAAAASRNIGRLAFAATSGTGTWDVYVINQAAQDGGLPVSFLQDSTTEFGFGNLSATDGASLLIGGITVTVPEPSLVALVAAACLVALGRVARR